MDIHLAPILVAGLSLALAMCANTTKPRRRTVPQLEAAFRHKDANHDEFLTKEEFTARAKDPKKASETFEAKDRNHDGKVSEQEFVTHIPRYLREPRHSAGDAAEHR